MTQMSGACFRCDRLLQPAQVDHIEVRMCPPCSSVLIRHEDLMQIIEQSWRAVAPDIAQTEPLHASAKPTGERVFHCPDCRNPMDKYGYMGLSAITIDRCDHCALIWLDAQELQNMTLVYAREQYRLTVQREKSRRESLDIASAGVSGAIGGMRGSTGMWLFRRRHRGLDVGWGMAAGAPMAAGLIEMLLGGSDDSNGPDIR
jgi:Zn-finger nucleic acid-binding protein